jgi:hypothetical protein
MKIKVIVLASLTLVGSLGFSQDITYAKEIVEKLASEDLKGRGYVSNGDRMTAEYISKEFSKMDLKSFKKSYFQKFSTSVNTFPGTMSLKMDSKELKPGVDFLIEPSSQGIIGTFETIDLKISDIFNRSVLQEKLQGSDGKFLVVEAFDRNDYSQEQLAQVDDLFNFLKYHPDNTAAGAIFLTENKLTWSASTIQSDNMVFTVKKEVWSSSTNTISVNIENQLIPNYQTQNVVGYIEGKNQDSLIAIIAHYDHLGMMGSETVFPGANDNASGIAMLLNLVKHYSSVQPNYKTVFIAMGGEELGLIGAKYFVENPLFELDKVKFLLNFDISGTGDDGIQVVNGSVYQDQFDRLVKFNEEQDLIFQVKIRGQACNSDHCMFDAKNVPCFYIYTLGGIQAYHDIYDKAETLPLTEFENYFKLMVAFVNSL